MSNNSELATCVYMKPSSNVNLVEKILGKEPNPVVEIINKRCNNEDTEAIYEAGLCWSYECGALVKAMRFLGYDEESINELAVTVSLMQDTCKAGELERIFNKFVEE